MNKRKALKGDRLTYVGPYAPGVAYRYPPGVVVGFRDGGRLVTVHLDSGGYADWPVDETAPY